MAEVQNGDAPKKRRGRPPKAKPKPEKVLGVYHVFVEGEAGTLVPLADVPGRNAEDALNTFLKTNEALDRPYVIVPQRNMTRLTAAVESVTKVRLKSA